MLRQNGWSERGITLGGLRQLKKALITAGSIAKIAAMPGVQADRAGVLPGGVAILLAMFEGLGVEQMATTSGSMREGLLYDLLGRIRHEDARDLTIRQFCQRYHVDMDQAARVERHRAALPGPGRAERGASTPCSAGRCSAGPRSLHEIGLSIAYSGYHRHGAYLVANSDMPGFSRADQDLLATLLAGQRKKLTREVFAALPAQEVELALRLCVLLRLAIRLARSRSPRPLPPFTVSSVSSVSGRKLNLEIAFPADWIEGHPLTLADLSEESSKLQGVGVELRVR